MAKRKKGIIITSTCALLAGAAVIAELALGGGTGGNRFGRQQGWQNLQKEIFDSAYSEESYDSAVEVPEYEGEPYVILDGNEPAFTEDEMTTTVYEQYSPLDSYGRCQTAEACVGEELMPDEKRGDISSVKPTGWQSVRYENVEGGSLYNRCHLIAYQLSGENANEENLITGTRYMNTEGMLPFENLVAEYVHETDNHVMYRVTPIYSGDDLVASGVQMEAKSVEDDGAGVTFNVYVYNVQPYVVINYETGESYQTEELATPEGEWAPGTEAEVTDKNVSNSSTTSKSTKKETYILNRNTKKFHKSTCSGVKDIKAENKEEYTGSRSDLIKEGYEPCGRCKP